MTKQTEAMKAALTALKSIDEAMPFPVAKFAIRQLEEALAEQPKLSDYEPDGMHHNKPHKYKYPKYPYPFPDLPDCRDAEQPAQRKPLTDEQINLFINGRGEEGDDDYVEPTGDGFGLTDADLVQLVRRVEAAHGIKGDA